MKNDPGSDESLFSRFGLPVIGLTGLVALWWLLILVFHVSPFVLPSPWNIVQAFIQLPRVLLVESWTTLFESLLGFGIATIIALVVALLITSWQPLGRAVMPTLVAINSVPKLAVAPLLVIWMGFGSAPKIIMVILICFFPIVLSAATGLRSTPGDFDELARSLSASGWKTFLKVRLPWALPQIFTGLKIGISLAVIGAVVAELQGAVHGLGFVILNSSQQANTALAFAAVVLLTVESLGLFYSMVGLEKLLLPWVKATTVN
jgi:NitT/TauT family transport system permease protein